MPMRHRFGLMCCLLMTLFLAPTTHAQSPASFDLPAQSLATSLRAVASQTGTNVLFDPPLVEGRVAPALKAQLTLDQAFSRLLAGTGLKYRFVDDKTVMVISASASPSVAAGHTSANTGTPAAGGQAVQLAQTNPAAGSPGDSATAENQRLPEKVSKSSSSSDEEKTGLSEIVVTGTHIRGAAPLSPVKTITNKDLIDQGYTRLDQAIEQLPENFKDGSSQESNGTLGIGAGYTFNGSFSSSVNLFGLGVGTTLILLNGQRLAPTGSGSHADISGISTSIIDRVEIVEDGASAVYGADAVGGVVNIITRKDYEGLETGARVTSISDGKTPNYGGYALAGTSWNTGNVVANFDYEKDNPLLADSRSFTSDIPGPLFLLPEQENFRLYAAAKQIITNELSISAQTLIPYRTYASYSNNGPYQGVVPALGSEFQPSIAIELRYDFASGWGASLSGDYSEDRNQFSGGYSVGQISQTGEERNRGTTAEARISGPLLTLPGGPSELALGGQFRSESFRHYFTETDAGVPYLGVPPPESGQRNAESAYAELLLPLIGDGNNVPLIRELAIDAAGRFDHYSDFGSSTNPKVTIKWKPVDSLSIHGTYTTSFRAPTFDELLTERLLEVYPQNNPASPSGVSRAILLDGGNPDLQPERSKSFSAGIDYKSTLISGLSGGLSYFHFDYTGRIEHLLVSGLGFDGFITNAAALGPLINLNPTAAQISAAYASVPPSQTYIYSVPPGTPAAIAAIAQVGNVNAASSEVGVVSGNLRYDTSTELGQIAASFDGTYLTKYEQRIAPESQPFGILNTLTNPLKFRAKGMLNWKWRLLAAYGRVNYANAYQNRNDLSCGASGCSIASWTTFDLGISYSTPHSADHRTTSGLRFGIDVVNVFDRAPPYALTPGSFGNLSYDPINANPLQRTLALTIIKKW